MHRFERCQSTKSMKGDRAGSGKCRLLAPGRAGWCNSFGHKSDGFHPLPVDKYKLDQGSLAH